MADVGETNGVQLLYKYRALEPFEYIADIIYGRRFHTAQFSDLNDPMEGLFNSEPGTNPEDVGRILEDQGRLRICSFSKTWAHPVLWAHYADGFRGICIEVEVTRTDTLDFDLFGVHYSRTGILFGNSARRPAPVLAREIFKQKARAWSVEKEVRTLTTEEYIPIEVGHGMRMTRIILGVRTPVVMKKLIRQMTPPDVPVWTTKIGAKHRIELDGQILPERR